MAHPAFCHQFYTPTTPDGIHEISPAPSRPLAVARTCPSPFDVFSDAPANHSPEVLAVASINSIGPFLALLEYDPCLIGGTITFDDAFFTTKTAIH